MQFAMALWAVLGFFSLLNFKRSVGQPIALMARLKI